MANVLAFYSDDPSSIPAGSLICTKKTKINEKEAGVGPSLKKSYSERELGVRSFILKWTAWTDDEKDKIRKKRDSNLDTQVVVATALPLVPSPPLISHEQAMVVTKLIKFLATTTQVPPEKEHFSASWTIFKVLKKIPIPCTHTMFVHRRQGLDLIFPPWRCYIPQFYYDWLNFYHLIPKKRKKHLRRTMILLIRKALTWIRKPCFEENMFY